MERGFGGSLSLDTWQRVALAVERPLRVELARDALEEVADAGHLAIQELVVRVARRAGYQARFELLTRPAEPARSADVGLRDDVHRRLVLVECWNTFGDLGAATRSTNRKLADAQDLAAVIGGGHPAPRTGSTAVGPPREGGSPGKGGPHREAGPPDEVGPPYAVGTVWVVRATRRNRALVVRYPELFTSRFPGSSLGWVRALTAGAVPPSEPGLVWCDHAATRLVPWRRH